MLRLALFAAALFALPASAQSSGHSAHTPDHSAHAATAPAHDSTEVGVVTIDAIPTYSAGMGRTDGPFTLVSLDGSIVVAPDATVRADSASGAWDIGIRGTEIIVNGGASGPGERRGVLLSADASEMYDIEAVLVSDGEGECPRGAARVVCHGSGNGWYEYASNGVQPIGRDLVVARADGTLLRVRFVRYVLGEALASGVMPRYVTLEVTPLADASAETTPDEQL